MKKLDVVDYKNELAKVTYLSEKHIDNFIEHLTNCMKNNAVELSDLAILFSNEKSNGSAQRFAINFIGYFYLSTFIIFMSILENYVFE